MERGHEARACGDCTTAVSSVYKESRIVVTGIGHPLYGHTAKYFPRKGQDHDLSHSLPDTLFTNYPPLDSTSSELLAVKLSKAEEHAEFTLQQG